MALIDKKALLKIPYLATYQGPAPWPVYHLFLLSPMPRPRRQYMVPEWTSHVEPRHLVLEGGEIFGVRAPEIPGGFYMTPVLAWNWKDGLERRSCHSIIVPIRSAAEEPMFKAMITFPSLFIQLDESRCYWAPLPVEPLAILRERVKTLAGKEGRTCYLGLDRERAIRFEADGAVAAVDGAPDHGLIARVPLYEWGQGLM